MLYVRDTYIGHDEIHDTSSLPSFADNAKGGDAKPLGKDVNRIGVVAPWCPSAGILLMGLVAHPEDLLLLAEYRIDDTPVGHLIAGVQCVRVVDQKHIPRIDVILEVLLDRLDGKGRGARPKRGYTLPGQ